jgi:hypothetical protein
MTNNTNAIEAGSSKRRLLSEVVKESNEIKQKHIKEFARKELVPFVESYAKFVQEKLSTTIINDEFAYPIRQPIPSVLNTESGLFMEMLGEKLDLDLTGWSLLFETRSGLGNCIIIQQESAESEDESR